MFKSKYLVIAIISIIALVFRTYLSGITSYYNDLYTFQAWSLELIRHGFNNFYDLGISDYPPGYLYMLWVVGKVFYFFAYKLNYVNLELIFKLPAIFADIGIGVVAFLLIRQLASYKIALISAVIYLFNPFSVVNSTIWGQVESVVTFFILLSLYFLISNKQDVTIKKILLSACMLGIAQTVKPIAVLALPLFLIYIFFTLTKQSIKIVGLYLLTFGLTIIVIFTPFNNTNNIFTFILNRYLFNLDWYPSLSLNAFNLWGITSLQENGRIVRVPDSLEFLVLSYKQVGYVLFLIIYSIVSWLLIKYRASKDVIINSLLIQSLGVVYLTMFMFFTRLHERHVFYGIFFMTLSLMIVGKVNKLLIIGLTAIHVINMYYAYQIAAHGVVAFNYLTIYKIIVANVVLYTLLLIWFIFSRLNFNILNKLKGNNDQT